MPGVALLIGGIGRQGQLLDIRHFPVVKFGDLPALLDETVQFGKLVDAEGGLDIHHVVFETGQQDIIVGGAAGGKTFPGLAAHAMEFHQRDLFGQVLVPGADHAPFAGGDVLVGMKGKDRDAVQGTDFLSLVLGSGGMGGILDDGQIKFCGQSEQWIQITGLAGKMNRDDCAGAGGDFLTDFGDINVQGARLDVGQHRSAAAEDDHADRGGEGHRGGDDLIPG